VFEEHDLNESVLSVQSVALKANVTANTIATARKFVATSVNTVAT